MKRWDGATRATREQVLEEWRLYFYDVISGILAVKSDHIDINDTVTKLAEEVVDTIEQAVRANAGRGL